jgi:hypothetical protein
LNIDAELSTEAMLVYSGGAVGRSAGKNVKLLQLAVQGEFTLLPGDAMERMTLLPNSLVSVEQALGAATGATLENSDPSALAIPTDSRLALQFDTASTPGDWAFRWTNPPSGDHVAELNALHETGQLMWNAPGQVSVLNRGDGYTYVAMVPEPTSFVLVASLLGGTFVRRR